MPARMDPEVIGIGNDVIYIQTLEYRYSGKSQINIYVSVYKPS